MRFTEHIKPVQNKTGINIKKLIELLTEHCVKARWNHGRISGVRLKQCMNLLGYTNYLAKLMQMNQECYAYQVTTWRVD